jgi:hypothetical protein
MPGASAATANQNELLSPNETDNVICVDAAAGLVEQSNPTAFLRATRQPDYDVLASKADADPAWLTQEVSFATSDSSDSIAPM